MGLKISTKKYQKWFITRAIRTFNNSVSEHVVQRRETSNYNSFMITKVQFCLCVVEIVESASCGIFLKRSRIGLKLSIVSNVYTTLDNKQETQIESYTSTNMSICTCMSTQRQFAR